MHATNTKLTKIKSQHWKKGTLPAYASYLYVYVHTVSIRDKIEDKSQRVKRPYVDQAIDGLNLNDFEIYEIDGARLKEQHGPNLLLKSDWLRTSLHKNVVHWPCR